MHTCRTTAVGTATQGTDEVASPSGLQKLEVSATASPQVVQIFSDGSRRQASGAQIKCVSLMLYLLSSQEALNKANAMGLPSPGGRVPIPAPASSKQQQQQGKGQAKANAGRGTAASQRGRTAPRPGRGGPPVPLRNLPQPRSRGPTPPPRPASEPHTLVKLANVPSSA